MRIYRNLFEAVKEVERDIWEMGVNVQVQSMQDKKGLFWTKELQAYGFQIVDYQIDGPDIQEVVKHVFKDNEQVSVYDYIFAEFKDRTRTGGIPLNPGNSYKNRLDVWNEYMHDGIFAYTYSERIQPQLERILAELRERPSTRQAIINIHSNIACSRNEVADTTGGGFRKYHDVRRGADLMNMGGTGRIPCSLYYQIMRRNGKVDLVYAMRSCDFLTHFVVDVCLAMLFQDWFAGQLNEKPGMFTYFTGSLHAYHEDMKQRGIF